MSVIRVGLTPAVSVPEALTFLYMIRSHDVHASREFRYMVDWFSQSLGDRNALHARSGKRSRMHWVLAFTEISCGI